MEASLQRRRPQKTKSCKNARRPLKIPQDIRVNSPANWQSPARNWISMRMHRETCTHADRHMWVGAPRNAPISLQIIKRGCYTGSDISDSPNRDSIRRFLNCLKQLHANLTVYKQILTSVFSFSSEYLQHKNVKES